MAKKQYIVLGLGIFGSTVAKTLSEYGYEVLAVDQDLSCVERVAPFVSQAVQADMTNLEQLKVIGASEFDVAIIGTSSNLENSLLAIINLRELGVPYIIAKARNKTSMKILEKIGVDRIIRPEKEMGERVAKSLLSSSIVDLIDIDSKYNIVEMICDEKWIGKSLRELDLRNRLGISIIGIRKVNESSMSILPNSDYKFCKDDHLLVVAETQDLERLDFYIKKK